ncbi:MAG: copper resistance protein CopC [Pseudomonadota bacterium]|nr:copper resistance protein CopC [Pseudomonadota bacterium]
MKAIAFTAALAAAVFAGTLAQAHAVLRKANPAPAAVVKTAPKTLRLHFNEAVLPKFTTLEVIGPNQQALHAGPVAVDRKTKKVVTAPLHGAGAPGLYTVTWTAATSDMHKMKGSYTFTVRP